MEKLRSLLRKRIQMLARNAEDGMIIRSPPRLRQGRRASSAEATGPGGSACSPSGIWSAMEAASGFAAPTHDGFPLARLTGRERQIAALAAQTITNQEIAEHLGISVETAKRHVKNLLHELELRDRAQLAAQWPR